MTEVAPFLAVDLGTDLLPALVQGPTPPQRFRPAARGGRCSADDADVKPVYALDEDNLKTPNALRRGGWPLSSSWACSRPDSSPGAPVMSCPPVPPRVLKRRLNGPGGQYRSQGSALVQALMAALIALIGASLLASRLLSSRFNVFSRSDTLAAREAAEFGLNELQARLNSDLRGYLWVTKRNSWSTVTRNALTTCQVAVRDASGNEVTTLPALPDGVSSARTIRSDADVVITYQLTAFEPPSLPDSQAATLDQVRFCGSGSGASTAAAFFGNLGGGSALMTVTGTVRRGSQSTTFRLSRRTDVGFPANSASSGTGQGDLPLRILGSVTADVNLGTFSRRVGHICYGTSDGCESDAINVGCAFASCETENSGVNPRQVPLLDMPASFRLPVGWDWATMSKAMSCVVDNNSDTPQCRGNPTTPLGSPQGARSSVFPYYNQTSVPTGTTFSNMTNSGLVEGCYFNNTNGANSSAINCLFTGRSGNAAFVPRPRGNRDLIVQTGPLPVNFFLYDTDAADSYVLSQAGIINSNLDNWSRLRILGRPLQSVNPSTNACNGARITVNQGSYIEGAFFWLPTDRLSFVVNANKSVYNVIWACSLLGSASGNNTNNIKIVSPSPSDSGFTDFLSENGLRQSVASSYRAFGGVNVVPGS